MHPTQNDLPASARQKVITLLSPLLADALDLYGQTKQAHWNVRGPGFIALHELFDQVATEVALSADEIAERIMQLGGEAPGTARFVAKESRLKDYPHLRDDGQVHVSALSRAIATFNANARKGIDAADEAGDTVTADILTQITGKLDKQMWFVEAHREEHASVSERKSAKM